MSWDYQEPYRQLIVPYPNVHLTFHDGAATVRGVSSAHQIRVLEGTGSVFGVAFRPGCFRPFLGAPVSTIKNCSIDATKVFGPDLPESVEVESVERFLRLQKPEPDWRAEQAAQIVATIATEPEITRVDAVARLFGMSVRSVQRLFAEYVGIGPKWVIRRYRLHEVTERLTNTAEIDWASLAGTLGYADQAHFARDFKKMFSESPTWYAQRYR
ncbi:helix-turn-helix domain-containing protein [Nocardia sp. NBC_00881]|nr:helix-turn-helix domain-containing protein [Nocardia sp. NBC_00881]